MMGDGISIAIWLQINRWLALLPALVISYSKSVMMKPLIEMTNKSCVNECGICPEGVSYNENYTWDLAISARVLCAIVTAGPCFWAPTRLSEQYGGLIIHLAMYIGYEFMNFNLLSTLGIFMNIADWWSNTIERWSSVGHSAWMNVWDFRLKASVVC